MARLPIALAVVLAGCSSKSSGRSGDCPKILPIVHQLAALPGFDASDRATLDGRVMRVAELDGALAGLASTDASLAAHLAELIAALDKYRAVATAADDDQRMERLELLELQQAVAIRNIEAACR